MLAKFPLFLSLFLFASFLAAAEYRHPDSDELLTGVPYYMAPYIWAIGGGVSPARVGSNTCPSEVRLTFETERGVPIVFSTSPYDSDSGESVVIDEKTEVYIKFINGAGVCHGVNTWGYRFASPLPSELPIELATFAKIYVRAKFSIKKEGWYYRVSSTQVVDSEENARAYYPVPSLFTRRLVLSSDTEHPVFYVFSKAEDYVGNIKSVV